MQRLVVIGRLEPARSLAHELMRHPEHGLHPVAVVHPSGATPDETTPLTGDIARLVDAIRSAEADVVAVVSEPDLSGVGLRRLAWALEDLGIDLLVAPGIVEVAGPRLSVRAVAGLSLLHLERPSSEVREIGKVILDRALAVGLLVAVLPALLVVVAAIRAASRGPILLRELRIGAAGQPFTMLRLRVPGVDRPAAAGLTRVIRRYRLDELPQLLNVLSGSMSLVGPRPRLPEHAIGDSAVMRRLRVRPGMTGLRQLGGGRALSREESLRLDLRYVDNWSVTLDLVILARSLLAIAKGQVEGSVTSAGQEQEPEGG
jgi:lipopolysaccharide/colanic/teichoic acid biosynthesis glycosyltransferase